MVGKSDQTGPVPVGRPSQPALDRQAALGRSQVEVGKRAWSTRQRWEVVQGGGGTTPPPSRQPAPCRRGVDKRAECESQTHTLLTRQTSLTKAQIQR